MSAREPSTVASADGAAYACATARHRGSRDWRTALVFTLMLMGAIWAFLAIAGGGVAAAAGTARWRVISQPVPANFPPEATGVRYLLTVENVGAEAPGGVTIEDLLPSGFTATAVDGRNLGGPLSTAHPLECALTPAVTCTDSAPIPTGDFLAVLVTLNVAPGAAPIETNTVDVSGGGSVASVNDATQVTTTVAGFGMQAGSFSTRLEAEDGTEELVAGSHPFAVTTSFALNTATPNANRDIVPTGSLKDLEVDLPPGLIGNPQAAPRCNPGSHEVQGYLDSCPVASQVGVANVVVGGPGAPLTVLGGPFTAEVPIYNVVPSDPTVTAEFGFTVETYPVLITASLKGNETVAVHLTSASETVPILSSSVTFWGVPSASAHDPQRFDHEGHPGAASNEAASPFLTEPTACLGPLTTTLQSLDSWQAPGVYLSPSSSVTGAGLTGCDALSFDPLLSVRPSTTAADAPAGYSIGLTVPQNGQPDQRATPALRDATVRLPLGTSLSPSAAGGLAACSNAEFEAHADTPASCPEASQVGTVTVTTPVLASPLEGQLFVAEPECGNAGHPTQCGTKQAEDGSLFRVFMQIEGPGIRVKLPGSVSVNATTGQLSASFNEDPQLPFTTLQLQLKSGPRAPLANSQSCGEAQTTSDLLPWSASGPGEAASPSSFFNVTGCASPTPLTPGFTAGTLNPDAGRASPFTLSLTRHDGEQDFSSLRVATPPGLLGMLSQVQLCPEPQASDGTCGPQSEIGHTSVAAGAGSQPFWTFGHVFLTGPYHGAPFGLSVVVPAVAGPFNLGNVIVRAAIHVDPQTAALTVTSGPLPQIIDGVPLRIKDLEISIDRPGFMFNPTNCAQKQITGSTTGAQGAIAAVSSPFAVGRCSKLPFKPSFKATTAANGNFHGASLDVKVSQRPGEANIAKVDTQLPLALSSRLVTLQKACTEAQFAANPAGCPAGSVVGTATAHTPVLSAPLVGPAILVSHGGAAFPDLDIILQGEGVRIVLTGSTNIKKGITYSRFETVPDAPISSFELNLPSGTGALLAAIKNLCATTKTVTVSKKVTRRVHGRSRKVTVKVKKTVLEPLLMPTTITGQNGAVTKQNTRIAVAGCARAKHHVKKAKRTAKHSGPHARRAHH